MDNKIQKGKFKALINGTHFAGETLKFSAKEDSGFTTTVLENHLWKSNEAVLAFIPKGEKQRGEMVPERAGIGGVEAAKKLVEKYYDRIDQIQFRTLEEEEEFLEWAKNQGWILTDLRRKNEKDNGQT